MWKSLAVITGLLLLGAGAVNYLQVRPALKGERAQAKAAEANKKSALANKNASNKAKEDAEKDLAEAKSELTRDTNAKNEALLARDAKVEELKKATEAKMAAEKELADLEQKLKDYGTLEVLAAELKKQEAELAALDTKVKNTIDQRATTVAHKEATDKVIANLKKLDLWQKTGTMTESFRTRVAAVNNEYGFVVLPAGNSNRVVRQAKLDVQRGGSKVGTLVVTHIEQNRAVAEVVPGSVAAGDSILPGDVVVVNDASKPKALESAPPPDTKKPGTTKPGTPADPSKPAETDPFSTPSDTPTTPATPSEPTPPAEPPPSTPAPDATPTPPEKMEEKKEG